jgi:hypothetical protein
MNKNVQMNNPPYDFYMYVTKYMRIDMAVHMYNLWQQRKVYAQLCIPSYSYNSYTLDKPKMMVSVKHN